MALKSWRQEDQSSRSSSLCIEFVTSLGYIRSCLNTTTKTRGFDDSSNRFSFLGVLHLVLWVGFGIQKHCLLTHTHPQPSVPCALCSHPGTSVPTQGWLTASKVYCETQTRLIAKTCLGAVRLRLSTLQSNQHCYCFNDSVEWAVTLGWQQSAPVFPSVKERCLVSFLPVRLR